MAAHARDDRDVVEFVYNSPEEMALRYRTGKTISTTRGDRVMFSLADERVMFLDLGPAQKVNDLRVNVGESFFVCKRRTGNGPVNWDVWLSPETQKARARRDGVQLTTDKRGPAPAAAAEDASAELDRQLAAPLTEEQQRRAAKRIPVGGVVRGVALDPSPATLLDALKTAVAAAHAAAEYAKGLGFVGPVQFTGEDLRCMAIAILANGGRH